jgi:hypothetical protein
LDGYDTSAITGGRKVASTNAAIWRNGVQFLKENSMKGLACVLIFVAVSGPANAQWRIVREADNRQSLPDRLSEPGRAVQIGDELPNKQKFRWLVADLVIPEAIDGQSTLGKTIGLQFNAADGGEIYIDGKLQGRYDNDHPLLAILTDHAEPRQQLAVAVQVFGTVQGGDKLDEAKLVVVPADRMRTRNITVQPDSNLGPVPSGLIGLSQGGGMSDYDDATATKLKEGRFQWFRMDNILTPVLTKNDSGTLIYDWADFDRRLDFIYKIGAVPIFAASYMPLPLDAVPNDDRQSAPSDYKQWENLCYEAARHARERATPVTYWEVWNEANSGWIKAGPHDTGSADFQKLYNAALGKEEPDHEIVRRFEAYAKLYQATARGVVRGDSNAKVGGPALASGPFEKSEFGHCSHGKGFARGLMRWCHQEKLPLDFVSWHEYFQSPDVIAKEADAFRSYLREFPELNASVKSFMITEWNEAWWPDRPQDHELGAAWCANGMIRAMIPNRIDKPCLFYVKQRDLHFRGDWSIIMAENRPKAVFNMARVFNSLSGHWLNVDGADDDICAVAAWDAQQSRLAIVIVNYRDRFAIRRRVHLEIASLPASVSGGRWQEHTIDSLHSNIFTDTTRCELELTDRGEIQGNTFTFDREMSPNSVVLVEVLAKAK